MYKQIRLAAVALAVVSQVATGQPRSTPTIELGRINITADRVDALVLAVESCYPEPSWIERTGTRVDLKGQAGYRQNRGANQYIITDNTSNFIGITVTVPLYNAQDVERDRTRELARRTAVSEAVGGYIEALGNLGANRAMVTLLQNNQKWVEARVSEGIAPTTDIVQSVNGLAGEARTEIKGIADYHASRAKLLALCPNTRIETVRAVMASLESGAPPVKMNLPESPKFQNAGGAP